MKRRRSGQASAEYAIVVALVAILLIATVAKYAASLGRAYRATTVAVEEQVTRPVLWDGKGPNPFRMTDPSKVKRRTATDPEGQEAR